MKKELLLLGIVVGIAFSFLIYSNTAQNVCQYDGQWGDGSQYRCMDDGTYEACGQNGTRYDHVNTCKEQCFADPQCNNIAPLTDFASCTAYGQPFLQDRCDAMCKLRDGSCESSYTGCTSDPDCDETAPGTGFCTYQCDYKPLLCQRDGLWGDAHEFKCRDDNTYDRCNESGLSYDHVNVCRYMCSASYECDGYAPGNIFNSCTVFGQSYLEDFCDVDCQIQDDNCESNYAGCTADPRCDEAVPGLNNDCDGQCAYHFCGDNVVDPWEQCELPTTSNNAHCSQAPITCLGNRTGTRDLFGDCNGQCGCNYDNFVYSCVKNQCGAECSNSEDCANKCVGNVRYFSGSCNSQETCSCSYQTENCDSHDGWYSTADFQWVSTGECTEKQQIKKEYLDYYCAPGNCSFIITQTKWEDTGQTRNKPNGTACTDGQFCTISDVCISGTCTGQPRNCDDGQFCTINDHCDESQDACVYNSRDCSGSNLTKIATCLNNPDANPFTWDYAAGFTSVCNEQTDSCTTGTQTLTHACSKLNCSAQCEINGDCPPSACSVIFSDYCTGKMLTEYNTNKILDNTTVSNSSPNTCLAGCTCTNNSVSCNPPQTQTYCVKDVCGAQCSQDSDCDDHNETTLDVCLENCNCQHRNIPICGNGNVEPSEQCELPNTNDNSYCNQSTTQCSGFKLGTRDAFGNCNFECGCNYDNFVYSCVKGQCGAECSNSEDCANKCVGNVRYYSGSCNSQETCSCSYQTENCDSYDGYYNTTEYRWVSIGNCQEKQQLKRELRDYSCAPAGCNYIVTNSTWADTGQVRNREGCVCERDGQYGQPHEFLCRTEGTYDRCNENGTGYDFVNICKQECSASPQCSGYAPNANLTTCTAYGQSYLQDYCNADCKIKDDNCESSYAGCTADPQCDEAVPGTGLCTYQCDYKPLLCTRDGLWGDGHEFKCRADNTYDRCNESGIKYDHINVCRYYCSASVACDGYSPGAFLSSCTLFGQSYLQDYCDASCQIKDDNCESSYAGCTADPQCDEAVPGQNNDCDGQCAYHFCGDNVVDPWEQCELPNTFNNIHCQQSLTECSGPKLGTRDLYGDCGQECGCSQDQFTYSCIKNQCGAECANSGDCANKCIGNTRYYSGSCESQETCSCSFQTENCDSLDGYYNTTEFQWVSTGECTEKQQIKREFRDYSCAPAGCNYIVTGTVWADTGSTRNKPDQTPCNDGLFCTTPDTCTSGICSGPARDCSGNNLSRIGECFHSPDANPFTWDYAAGFTSVCNEATDQCTTGTQTLTHACSKLNCSAQCETNGDCSPSTCDQTFNDYCTGLKLTEYNTNKILDSTQVSNSTANTCLGSCLCTNNTVTCNPPQTQTYCVKDVCGAECDKAADCPNKCVGNIRSYSAVCSGGCFCSYQTENCDALDGYYNTTELQWISTGECTEKQQIKQEFRDYSCAPAGCNYIVTGTIWIDTGQTRNKPDQTPCNDGLYCTTPDTCTNGVCGGPARDCSGSNLSRIAECFHSPDGNPFTWDYAAGFTSVCNEQTDSCTTGTQTLTHACSKLNCSAQCETSSDCPPFLSDSICHFGRACQESCLCTPGQEEFCPVPGTVMDSTCYYGEQSCTNEGCGIQSCTLTEHQICDPVEGCFDVPCLPIPPITIFSDGSAGKLLVFDAGGGTNKTAKVILPANFNATGARVNLTGIPQAFTGEKKLDVVVVNDLSGSMDDNCGPDGTAQPGETPCKINDMKNATAQFANAVLLAPDNKVGLSSYNSKSINSLALTRNITAITNEVNTYNAFGFTCISCGIVNGTNTVKLGTNPIKAILLMTDGNANRCLPGVACTDFLAKQEAINKAAEAWSNYGISIYAVAFGTDADVSVMQQIANVSHGKFYLANDTNITDVYAQIAIEITQSFITNASLDVGGNGVIEWSHSGVFNTTEMASGWYPEVNSLLNGCNCTGCSKNASTGECTIDMWTHSDSAGKILLNNLSIEGCVYMGLQVGCSSCSECGGGEDCKDFGSWSEPSCDWSGSCDESADCTSSRNVTTFVCNNPGSVSSFCSMSKSAEQQHTVQTNETDGAACEDGQFCTMNDACSSGVCTGQPRVCNDGNECTDDSCNEQTDMCSYANDDTNVCGAFRDCPDSHCIGLNMTTYPQSGHDHCQTGSCISYSCASTGSYYNPDCESDSDGDGIPDSQDACPSVAGSDCHGCPNPCTGCAEMVCGEGAPTCQADDSQCSPTACPEDGCGLGLCPEDKLTDYPEFSDDNTCMLDGTEGICTQNECGYQCVSSEQCTGECGIDNFGITVFTDEHIYNPENTVQITGNVLDSSCEPVQQGDVAIQVGKFQESPIYIAQVQTDGSGLYSTAFMLPPDVQAGNYTVYAAYSGESNTTIFEVVIPGETDSDGDGIPDSQDACPSVAGSDCNGCPNPCTGCAEMVCGEGAPTCQADDSQCSPTACPEDGCGLGFCNEKEFADLPGFMENSCFLDGNNGFCTENECEALSCTPSEACLPPADHVVFSEVMYDAPAPESDKEWFEIYNPTDLDVNLGGWKVYHDADTPSSAWDMPNGVVIRARGYITVARDAAGFYSLYGCYPTVAGFTRPLANAGDMLKLKSGEDEIDMVAWNGFITGWIISASDNKTISRSPVQFDTDTASDWLSNTNPTPNPCLHMTTFVKPLKKGWNLISIPVNSSSKVIEDVLSTVAGKYDIVRAYDPVAGWKTYDPANPGFSDLLTIIPENGYWINMTEDAGLSVTGMEMAYTPIPVVTGWNLIGYPTFTVQNVTDGLHSVSGNYTLVRSYDPVAGWKTYDPANPGFSDLAEMSPGLGYWIDMTVGETVVI